MAYGKPRRFVVGASASSVGVSVSFYPIATFKRKADAHLYVKKIRRQMSRFHGRQTYPEDIPNYRVAKTKAGYTVYEA